MVRLIYEDLAWFTLDDAGGKQTTNIFHISKFTFSIRGEQQPICLPEILACSARWGVEDGWVGGGQNSLKTLCIPFTIPSFQIIKAIKHSYTNLYKK